MNTRSRATFLARVERELEELGPLRDGTVSWSLDEALVTRWRLRICWWRLASCDYAFDSRSLPPQER